MNNITIDYHIPKVGGGIYASNCRVQPWKPNRTEPMSES
nr:MAG TPA: hypothetical protein [Caudoviricetes sp.]